MEILVKLQELTGVRDSFKCVAFSEVQRTWDECVFLALTSDDQERRQVAMEIELREECLVAQEVTL